MILLNLILSFGFLGLAFSSYFLPQEIVIHFHKVQKLGCIIIFPFIVFNWIAIFKNKTFQIFISTSIMMVMLSGFLTPKIFNFLYAFGENDLIKYAQIAKNNHYTISTYLIGKKYSLLYYGNQDKIEIVVV